MPRQCSVCTHDDREAVDQQLVSGVAYRDIAAQTGLSLSALSRHRESHVSPAIQALQAEREREHGETLLDRIEDLYGRAERLLTTAEQDGKVTQALGAIRELRAVTELLGKATGELREQPTTVVNIVSHPEWVALRGAILRALEPYPDARMAVAQAAGDVEQRPALESGV